MDCPCCGEEMRREMIRESSERMGFRCQVCTLDDFMEALDIANERLLRRFMSEGPRVMELQNIVRRVDSEGVQPDTLDRILVLLRDEFAWKEPKDPVDLTEVV